LQTQISVKTSWQISDSRIRRAEISPRGKGGKTGRECPRKEIFTTKRFAETQSVILLFSKQSPLSEEISAIYWNCL
jgi:hypothetical protein